MSAFEADIEKCQMEMGNREHRLEEPRAFLLTVVAATMTTAAAAAMAASFGPVRYDPNTDRLVITMIYDGTNPNHHFSIEWGICRKLDRPDQPGHQTIDVSIFDDQWNDAVTKTYTETVTVPLATVPCRPATVILRTAPNFITTLDIPARP